MSLLSASAASVVVRVAFQLLSLLVTILLARELGTTAFGAYSFALTVVMFLALPCRAGLPQIVTRETATSLHVSRWPNREGVWRWAVHLTLIVSVIVLAMTLVVAYTLSRRLPSAIWVLVVSALPLIPALTLTEIHSAAVRGAGRIVSGQVPELVVRPSVQLVMLLGVIFILKPYPLEPLHAVVVYIVAAVTGAITSWVMLCAVRPYSSSAVVPEYRGAEWLVAAAPVGLVNSMHLINTQADTFLIGMFSGAQDVGIYRVAAQLSLVVAFGLHATKLIVQPRFATLYWQGKYHALQSNAIRFARLNLGVAITAFAFLVTMGRDLLPMAFGAGFDASYVPLLILAGGHVFGSLFGASGVLLIMAGYERRFAKFSVLAAVLNVALNIVLIPRFGIHGAAWATAITMPIPHVLGWWLAIKCLQCNCSPFSGSWGISAAARNR